MRNGRQKIGPRIFYQSFDLPLVVALARTTKAIVEQKVADEFGEGLRAPPFAVAQYLRHGDLEIVVENRQRNAAEKGEGRDMAVEKRLRRLRRIGLDEAGVRMRQVEAEHMQLHPHAADDADAFAKIDLRVTRRMSERHEDLARARARQPHIILHHRVAAGEAVLIPQPFENPLRRMPLLRRRRLVGLQDRVDHREQRPELRPLRRLCAHVTRRRRIAAHLRDRVPAQSKHARRFTPAIALNENKASNRRVNLHRKHPRPPSRINVREVSLKLAGFYAATRPQYAPLIGRLLRRRVHAELASRLCRLIEAEGYDVRAHLGRALPNFLERLGGIPAHRLRVRACNQADRRDENEKESNHDHVSARHRRRLENH